MGAPPTGGCPRRPRRPAQREPPQPHLAPGHRCGHPSHPPLRPYGLRHAALSLWLASGAPPAEIAGRAGHSVHVLLATYTHCLPGYGQIASQHIDRALHASTGPPLAHKPGHHPARSRPSCVRATAGPDGTQRDLIPPAGSKVMPVTCTNTDPEARLNRPRP
jgi:hypothetical protein